MTAQVELHGVSKRLPDGRTLFDNVDLTIRAGESLAIVGRSGSGKSTFLSALALMQQFDSGTFRFKEHSVRDLSVAARDAVRAGEVGFVFQRFLLLKHITVLENVMVPLRHRGHESARKMRERAFSALSQLGMDSHASKRPAQLSGGEQQRVSIARAIVTEPSLLLADEPTGSLDSATADTVMKTLLELASSKHTALTVVTHDLSVATRIGTVYHLDDGRLRLDTTRRTQPRHLA